MNLGWTTPGGEKERLDSSIREDRGSCGYARSERCLEGTPRADELVEGALIPCPLCGCPHSVEGVLAANPCYHATHQCLRCGCWFDDQEALCSRCGSPGEFLGNVITPGRGLYAQYRCQECGHGFMLRIND